MTGGDVFQIVYSCKDLTAEQSCFQPHFSEFLANMGDTLVYAFKSHCSFLLLRHE